MEVQCDVEKCKFNDDGACTKAVITVGEDKECEDYELYRR